MPFGVAAIAAASIFSMPGAVAQARRYARFNISGESNLNAMRAADSAVHGIGLGFGFHNVKHTLRAWRVLRPPDVLMIGEEFQRRQGIEESPLGDQGEQRA